MDSLDIVIGTVASLTGLASLAAAREWPGGPWLSRQWRRIEPFAGCYIRRSPATFAYAGILLVTTWVVAGLGRQQSGALLRSQSTNLDNLRTHPVDVLFRSAFWSGQNTILPVVALLALVLAPAEVWLGTARMIGVFAAGHVGATLVTAVAISHGYFSSAGDQGITRAVDVGVSYGTLCVAAVLTHRLPPGWRLPSAAALLLVCGLFAFAAGTTFTDFGHFVAVVIGLVVYPVIRSASVAERSRIPMYRPWKAAAELEPVRRLQSPAP
jgi:hypothetical protein